MRCRAMGSRQEAATEGDGVDSTARLQQDLFALMQPWTVQETAAYHRPPEAATKKPVAVGRLRGARKPAATAGAPWMVYLLVAQGGLRAYIGSTTNLDARCESFHVPANPNFCLLLANPNAKLVEAASHLD
jgi:hypothetical protein